MRRSGTGTNHGSERRRGEASSRVHSGKRSEAGDVDSENIKLTHDE